MSAFDPTPPPPDHEAYTQVCDALADGDVLTMQMIGRVFGEAFWLLLWMDGCSCHCDCEEEAAW